MRKYLKIFNQDSNEVNSHLSRRFIYSTALFTHFIPQTPVAVGKAQSKSGRRVKPCISLTEPDLQAQDVKSAEFTAAATRSAAMLSGAAVQERLVPPGELAVLRGDSDRQSRGTCEKLRQNCLKKGGPTRTCQFL